MKTSYQIEDFILSIPLCILIIVIGAPSYVIFLIIFALAVPVGWTDKFFITTLLTIVVIAIIIFSYHTLEARCRRCTIPHGTQILFSSESETSPLTSNKTYYLVYKVQTGIADIELEIENDEGKKIKITPVCSDLEKYFYGRFSYQKKDGPIKDTRKNGVSFYLPSGTKIILEKGFRYFIENQNNKHVIEKTTYASII